jgi:hypothetical protein
MRALTQYEFSDWLCATPLVHGFKRARNIAIERAFRGWRPRALEHFLADHGRLAGGSVAFAVAYNTPWVIDLLTRAAKVHLAADALIIVDNSRDVRARREIEQLCQKHGASYLGLPFNPEWHPCRSNGLAMTWVYYNVVQALKPRVFGFLDHDLIPLDHLDLGSLVAAQPFYGKLNLSRWGWNLWAGYCVYDFTAVAAFPLDFNNDVPRLLDTGGQNFSALYRHHDRAAMRFARENDEAPLLDPLDGSERHVQLIDDCAHISRVSYDTPPASRPDRAFYQRLVQACERGMRLADFQPRKATVAVASSLA